MPHWINMRREVAALINGDRRSIGQGGWAVIRIMRLYERSQYWDADRNEAVGGPPYNYDDFLVRVITKPGFSLAVKSDFARGLTNLQGLGEENLAPNIFAVEWNPDFPRMPDSNDILYEIAEYEGVERPTPPLTAINRFKIIETYRDYGDHGRLEVLFLLGARIHGES